MTHPLLFFASIRYIDLRVGFYKTTDEKFWANHGIARLHPLTDILTQIKQFVDATNEIVIVDFQEFPIGFQGIEVHEQFVFFLFEQMAEYAADSKQLSWDSPLDDIWRSRKRVILGYDHYGMAQNDQLGILWQSARHRWGKVNKSSEKLQEFLKESRSNMSREFQTPRPFAGLCQTVFPIF